MSPPCKSHPSPILCYVTDRKSLGSVTAGDPCDLLLQRIADAAIAGIDWIQIREKDLHGHEYALLVREALAQTKRSTEAKQPARILVNDRLDIALTEHASGVHLGENSLPVKEVRPWFQSRRRYSADPSFLVGASCHSKEAAVSAARDGADYIFFGPVFAMPSKAAFGAPQGLERLAEVCRSVFIPVVAIGGITEEHASACLMAGAAGIAAIRLFQQAADLPSLVASLRGIQHGGL